MLRSMSLAFCKKSKTENVLIVVQIWAEVLLLECQVYTNCVIFNFSVLANTLKKKTLMHKIQKHDEERSPTFTAANYVIVDLMGSGTSTYPAIHHSLNHCSLSSVSVKPPPSPPCKPSKPQLKVNI